VPEADGGALEAAKHEKLLLGLEIYQHMAPDIVTPAVSGRASQVLADLYPED
jgi:hypothetical protein